MRESLNEDLSFYHRLHLSQRRETSMSRMRIAFSSRGLWQLLVHRLQFALHARRHRTGSHFGWLALAYLIVPLEVLIKVVAKCELLESTQLDGGIYLSNRGYVMLGARHVGRGSVIHHNVTVGVDAATGGLPDIREDVWIGPDSIIFGAITVGAGSTVLPGSVLTRNAPPRSVVQGNPARVIRRDFDNSALRAGLDIDSAAAAAQTAG